MIQEKKLSQQVIWYDDSYIDEVSESIFDSHYWQQQNKVLGSAKGRGTTWFVQTPKLVAALRHYCRGGLFGKIVKDYYLFKCWHCSRPHLEFQLLHTLITAGVHVPRPIAARAVKKGFVYQADILTEKIKSAHSLLDILSKSPVTHQCYQQIGREIAKMHTAQVNHTDLNIHNILIDAQQQVWIIDFDKCSVEQGDNWKEQNLARLKRSFAKELNKRQIHWQESDFAALLDGYKQK